MLIKQRIKNVKLTTQSWHINLYDYYEVTKNLKGGKNYKDRKHKSVTFDDKIRKLKIKS